MHLLRSAVVLFALCAALSSLPAHAQLVCALGPATAPYNPYFDTHPTAYAAEEFALLQQLLCPNGCGNLLYVQNASVPNAMTMTVGYGTSKISYSPQFMNTVIARYGPGASFGVIAHELGHHLDALSPAAWYDHSWGRELRADSWAGCALARAGLHPTALQQATMAIAAFPSPSHPGWNLRLPAIQAGFQACGGTWSVPGTGNTGSPSITAPASGRLGASTGSGDEEESTRWHFRYKTSTGWKRSGGYTSEESCEAGREGKSELFDTTPCE